MEALEALRRQVLWESVLRVEVQVLELLSVQVPEELVVWEADR